MTNNTPATDAYFTTRDRAALCIEQVRRLFPEGQLFIEPSAGAGAFLHQLPHPRIGIDIAPQADDILRQDFLTWTAPEGQTGIVVIGNPPFGKNAKAAVAFFNHAAQFADCIALIVPASFRKAAVQNRLDHNFILAEETVLSDEAFEHEGKIVRFSVSFQIWLRSATPRLRTKPRTTHPDFRFVPGPEEADFVMRRVGAHAGKIMDLPAGDPGRGFAPTSNYFVQVTAPDVTAVRARFESLDFSDVRADVVAVPSIAKSEIIALYDAATVLAADPDARAPERAFPVIEVHELHGTTPRRQLSETLVPPEEAGPGDIVAVWRDLLWQDDLFWCTCTTFLVQGQRRLIECRLSDLPPDLVDEAALCLAKIDDDWEIAGEFLTVFPELEDDGIPRRLTSICLAEALFLCATRESWSAGKLPVLDPAMTPLAALLVGTIPELPSQETVDGVSDLIEGICLRDGRPGMARDPGHCLTWE